MSDLFRLDQGRVLRPGQAFQLIWEKFLTSEPKWLTGARTENQENGNLVQPRKVQPERYNPQQLPISGHDPFVYLDFKSLNLLMISTNWQLKMFLKSHLYKIQKKEKVNLCDPKSGHRYPWGLGIGRGPEGDFWSAGNAVWSRCQLCECVYFVNYIVSDRFTSLYVYILCLNEV